MFYIPQKYINKHSLWFEPVLAPSAGHNQVNSHLLSTSWWLDEDLSSLSAQCVVAVSEAVHRLAHHHFRSPKRHRERERMGGKKGFGTFLHKESIVSYYVRSLEDSLFDAHRVTHCPRYQESMQYTHKLCSHPPLALIQCSNSRLFCNAVTQSHQLFIKEFCTCSVIMGLIDRKTVYEEVKHLHGFLKMLCISCS